MLVVYVHHQGHVVPGGDVLVDIPGDELGGQVPRPPAHAVHRGVQKQLPLCLDLPQDLGVGKGQLQIVVAVEPQPDARGHVLVQQVEPPGHLVAVHAAQGVHDIEA